MSDGSAALIDAVGNHLPSHPQVIAAFGPDSPTVFDVEVPKGRPSEGFPYIVLSDVQIIPNDNLCERNLEVLFDAHIWCRDASNARCRAIASAVREALYRSVSGRKLSLSHCA